jgi:single-stranded-DNA-specific exonuclease
MAAACDAIRTAVATVGASVVHGDYDADGICATALAVLILRQLGAEVEWHLPAASTRATACAARRSPGWLRRLRPRPDRRLRDHRDAEVAAAKALGLEIVISDHHRPAEELPDCPLVGRTATARTRSASSVGRGSSSS